MVVGINGVYGGRGFQGQEEFKNTSTPEKSEVRTVGVVF